MRKVRIGVLILSNSWGGAEESVYNIAKNIDKKHFLVYLLINEYLRDRYKTIKGAVILNLGRLESNKKLQKIYNIYKIKSKLFKFVRKYRLEVIHAQLENSLLVLGIPQSKLSVQIIFTLRGDEVRIYHNPKTFEQKIISKLLKNMLLDKRIALTSISNWLIRGFDGTEKLRINVIPNGIDCDKYHPLGLKRQKKSVFFAGRYVEGKGIEDLIRVAKKLKGYDFLFAGKGPLENVISLKNTKDLGFKSREELVNLYNTATICVFPSHREAFGNVGLEAMACGAAIVATDVGFSEYVEDGVDGVIVTPGDVRQLKRAIVKLITDPNLRGFLGENARRKALRYDIRKTVRMYQDLYHKVVAI